NVTGVQTCALPISVFSDSLHRSAKLTCVDRVEMGQRVNIGEVTPAGIGEAAVDGRHDLLGQHHRQGVSQERHGWATERYGRWKGDRAWCGRDRVAEVYVHSSRQSRGAEARRELHPYPSIFIVIAHRRRGNLGGIEYQSVGKVQGRDCADTLGYVIRITGESGCLQINVLRRAARSERGEQHAAL